MVFSLLIPVVILALVVLIVVVVAGIRVDPKKGGEEMIKNVFIYLVLFATLMMTIGGSVSIFMAAADIIAPAPYYQSFEEFKRWGNEKPYPEKEAPEETKLSEEELRERYDAMVLAEREKQVSRAKNTLIKSFGWIIIPFPIFLSFRRLVKSEA